MLLVEAGAAPDELFFDVPALARISAASVVLLSRAPTPPPPQAMHVYGTPHHWDLRTAPEPEPVWKPTTGKLRNSLARSNRSRFG